METGLVIAVPEAEPTVADFRNAHDTSALLGMPAHVTILYPFMPFEDVSEEVIARLQAVFAAHAAIPVVFRRTGRFPGFVWLAPEPAEPLIALTQAVERAFPNYPAYAGEHAIVPHLTVAQAAPDVLDKIEAALRQRLVKPVCAAMDRVSLFVRNEHGWRVQREFALRAAA